MKITFENQIYEVEPNQTVKEALGDKIDLEHVIAVKYNNFIASLNHPLKREGTICPIKRTEKDGRIIYIRGLLYLMSKAFYEMAKKRWINKNLEELKIIGK